MRNPNVNLHTTMLRNLIASAVIVGGSFIALSTHAHDSGMRAAPSTTSSKMDHGSMDDMHHHHMKMTGNVDYDFAVMMRMHHEQGVKMAQKELDNGKNSDMRAAAQKIVDAQTKEIAEFDKWIAEHPQKSK